MLSVALSNRSAMISQATTTSCCLRIAGRFLDFNGVVGSSPVILSLLVGSSRLLSTTTQAFLHHITFGLLVSLVRFTLMIATPHSFASPVIPPSARSPWPALSVCYVAPEQKLFYGNLCFLTLSSVYQLQGFSFAKVFCSLLLSVCFLAPEQKLFLGNFCFLSLSSVHHLRGLSFAKCFVMQCVVWLHTREIEVRGNFLFLDFVVRLLFMSSRGSVSLILLPPLKLTFLCIQCGSYILYGHFLFTWL